MALSVASQFPVGGEWFLEYKWASPESYNSALYRVWQQAIQVCMSSRGFKYVVGTYTNSDLRYRAINPLNRNIAEVYGYHLPAEEAGGSAGGNDQGDTYNHGRDDCANTAQSYVYQDELNTAISADLTGLRSAALEAVGSFLSSDEGSQRLERWHACIVGKGYSYRSPADMAAHFSAAATVSKEEIRARMADLECDEDSSLTKSRSLYELTRLRGWLQDNAEGIGNVEAQLDAAEKATSAKAALLESVGVNALGSPKGVAPGGPASTLAK